MTTNSVIYSTHVQWPILCILIFGSDNSLQHDPTCQSCDNHMIQHAQSCDSHMILHTGHVTVT